MSDIASCFHCSLLFARCLLVSVCSLISFSFHFSFFFLFDSLFLFVCFFVSLFVSFFHFVCSFVYVCFCLLLYFNFYVWIIIGPEISLFLFQSFFHLFACLFFLLVSLHSCLFAFLSSDLSALFLSILIVRILQYFWIKLERLYLWSYMFGCLIIKLNQNACGVAVSCYCAEHVYSCLRWFY